MNGVKFFKNYQKRGLIKRNKKNRKNQDETIYLKHTQNVIENKKNRAQLLIDQYNIKKNLDFFKMKKKILVIQGSDINKINYKTDTSVFLGLEAQRRKFDIFYYEPKHLGFKNGHIFAECFKIKS